MNISRKTDSVEPRRNTMVGNHSRSKTRKIFFGRRKFVSPQDKYRNDANRYIVIISTLEDELNDLRKQNSILSSKLSKRNLNPREASEKHAKLASDFAERIYPIVSEIRNKGYSKLYEIAEQLNSMGLTTRTGSAWTSTAVMRLERRQQEQTEEV